MTKTERDKIVHQMVQAILQVEYSFTREEFARRWPFHPATFGDLLTEALDIVRRERNQEFSPGPPGTLHRSNFRETINRSNRKRRAGLRRLERAAICADVAASIAQSPQAREAAERLASLQKLQLTAARIRDRKRLKP